MTASEVRVRGLPEWLLRAYLEELGGRAEPQGEAVCLVGEGWTVSWSGSRADLPGGSLRLTEYHLVFEGEAATVDAVREAFLKKAQRGGG